jgi:spermidine/putrescine transport system substrate-binding protein
MKKRIVALLCAAVMTATLFTGCGTKSTNGVVSVYNWGEYIDTDLLKEFTAQTGIAVNYSTYDSNENLYTKLRSGSVNYDVIIPSDYMISRLIDEGLLMKLDFDQIPNFENVDEAYRNMIYDPTNEYSVPYTWGTTGIIYNPNMVDQPITSWADLFDTELLNKHSVLMFDNSRDCIAIALMALGYDINTENADEITAAVDLLIAQKKSGLVQAYVMDQIFDKMANNEAAVGVYYAGDYLIMLEDNPDLVWVQPSEGANLFVDAMCVPTTCQNYDNAMAFINFMCENTSYAANFEEIGYALPSSGATALLDEEYSESPVLYPEQSYLDSCESFINLNKATLELYDSEWLRLGLAQVG